MIDELARLSKSLLGNPTRLAIALYLLSRERTTFAELRKAVKLTSGNLGFLPLSERCWLNRSEAQRKARV